MAQAINIVRTAAGVSFSPAQLAVETGADVFWVTSGSPGGPGAWHISVPVYGSPDEIRRRRGAGGQRHDPRDRQPFVRLGRRLARARCDHYFHRWHY